LNNYYQDLGVARDASAEDIKRAYHRLARKLHPDVNADDEAEDKFKKVSQAYDVLSDAEKRRAYDAGSDPYGGASGGFGQGFSFSDVMDAFFGQGAGGAGRGPRSRQRRGQDALIRLEIDLSQAVFGAERELAIDTAVACGTCHGNGSQPGTGTRLGWIVDGSDRHVQVTFRSGAREALCGFSGHSTPDGTPCRGCLSMLYRALDESVAVYV